MNAQRFFKRRSNVIGLLVPPQEEMGHNAFNDTHFVEILSGIEKALCRTGYNLLLLFNRPEFQENNHYAGLFQSGFLDGLLIWGVHRLRPLLERTCRIERAADFPDFAPGAESSASLSFVASDYEHSAFGIVSHLREKGRRSFCWLAGKEDTSIIPQLEAGIRRAGVRIPARRRSVTATIRKPTESGLPPNCWQPADTTRSSQPLRSWRAAPRAASPPGILPPRSDASTARAAPVLPQTVSSPH